MEEKVLLKIVCFSMDRVFQLSEYLRTLHECLYLDGKRLFTKENRFFRAKIYIICRCTSTEINELYQEIASKYPHVCFLYESDSQTFAQCLLKSLDSNSMSCEYVLFNVDDAFYVNRIDLQPAMAFLKGTTTTTAQKPSDILDKQNATKTVYNFSFHLKMTPSTWMSHMRKQAMLPLPPFSLLGKSCPIRSVQGFLNNEKDSYLMFDPSKGCVDWNYPWDLSGSLYTSQTVDWLINEIVQQHGMDGINHPSRLELNGDQVVKKWQQKQYSLRCACPNEPKMYVFAINQVQEVFQNPLHKVTTSTLDTSTDGDLESLKGLYLERKHLDLNFYRSKRLASVHIGHLELEKDSKRNEPLVSVVIPVYNVEKFIEEAIESIINQSYRNLEILVIDDASTDNTRSIVASLIQKDPRIQLFVNESNSGIAYTLNRGFQLSKGDFIARMDGDDVSSHERIKKQIDYLQTHAEIDILGTSILIAREKKGDNNQTNTEVVIYPTSPSITKWRMFFGCFVAHPTVMLRRQVLTKLQESERTSYYSLGAICIEDYELWLRCLVKHGIQIASLGEVLLYHRKHTKNTCKIHRERQVIETQELTKKYLQLFLNEEEEESIPMDAFSPLVNATIKPKTCWDLEKAIYLIDKLCSKVTNGSVLEENKEMFEAEQQFIQQEAVARQGEIALRGMLTFSVEGGRLWANWSEKHPVESRLAFQRFF